MATHGMKGNRRKTNEVHDASAREQEKGRTRREGRAKTRAMFGALTHRLSTGKEASRAGTCLSVIKERKRTKGRGESM